MTGPVASFHLVRQHAARAPVALARLTLDRRPLARADGLRFVRLLGTSRGRTTSLSIDPARTAAFCVWDDDDAFDAFLRTSPVAARWRRATEHYAARLRLVSGRGSWAGRAPLVRLPTVDVADDAPIAVLTRADVHVRSWRSFTAAGRAVSDALAAAPGLLAVVGIGEAPVGRQATFSLWRDAAAVDAFAYANPWHVDVIRRTRAERWYGDELFARFAPETIEGTWDGVDPLA